MKLGDTFKEVLKESKTNNYDYGCIMLYLNVDNDWWEELQGNIDEEDLYLGTEDDPGYGREDEPHLTILFGIHADVSDEAIQAMVNKMTAPEVLLKKIGMFDNAHKGFDVVKFDVEGEDLHKMNKLFTQLPHTTDYPDYHPHCTIAYVKSGTGKKYTDDLNDEESLTLTPHKIVYSKPDGTKKEYSFS